MQAIVIAAVYYFRLEVAVPTSGSIYFSSGTAAKVVVVESTMLLPLLFVVVAALFATLAQRMGREMALLPPLRAYTINLAGSLAGVIVLGVVSWLELPPAMWFGIAFAAAIPLLLSRESPENTTNTEPVNGAPSSRAGSPFRWSSSISRCLPYRWSWSTSWRAARSGLRITRSPSASTGPTRSSR